MNPLLLSLVLATRGPVGIGMEVAAPYTSIAVMVGDVDADAEKEGLTEAAVQNQIELALRRNGIVVDPKSPFTLVVTFQTLSFRQGYATSWSIQAAIIKMVDGVLTLVVPWATQGILVGPHGDAPLHVRTKLEAALDSFCNELLAARAKVSGARRAAD
jgi:hypothetical protein